MAKRNKQDKSLHAAHRFADSPLLADDGNRFLMSDGSVRWLATGASPMSGRLWMAGHTARYCVYYGVDKQGKLLLVKRCDHPFLTSKGYSVDFDYVPVLTADDVPLREAVSFIEVKGGLRVVSATDGFEVEHVFYPAVQSAGLIERVTVANLTAVPQTVRIHMPTAPTVHIKGGSVPVSSGVTLADERGRMLTDLTEADERVIPSEGTGVFYLVYWSKPRADDLMVDCRLEWKKRMEQVSEGFADTLTLSTPEPIFDRAFAHALTFASEHLMDTPEGVLPFADRVRVADVMDVLPLLPMSGVHRAAAAASGLLNILSEQAGVPLSFDAAMCPTGACSSVTYALGLTRYALVAGQAVAASVFGTVETTVERMRRALCDGLYRPKRLADLATQCAVYALFTQASMLAFALDMPMRGTAWQGAAALMRRRIGEKYLSPMIESARKRRADKNALYAALYYGLDDYVEPIGRALIAAWMAEAEQPVSLREDTVAPLNAIYALARAGYADAAYQMALRYTQEMLLGAHAPYSVDAHPPYGDQSPYVAWRYCHTLLYGWLGLDVPSLERLTICLHLPRAWRRFAVRGIHIGALVLDVVWHDDHLLIKDIFGQTYYDGQALCGQHVEVALSH